MLGREQVLADELAALSAAAAELAAQPTRRTLLERAAHHLTLRTGATATLVSRLENDVLRTAAAYSLVPLKQLEEWDYLVDDYPVTRLVLDERVARGISLADERIDAAEEYVLRQLGMHEVLMLPVVVDDGAWGLVEIYDSMTHPFGPAEEAVAQLLVGHLSALLAKFEHADATQRVYRETLASLADALEAKDAWTSDHTKEVVRLAVAVGRKLALDDADLRVVELGALLHDIGKIAVPEAILRKPGSLSEEDWQVMRRHPEAGARLLEPISALSDVLPVVRGSHERWDGAGYPDGLAGAAIPLAARIVAVCDAYCAMIEPRPYRASLTPEQAVAELKAHAGTQFETAVVEAFLRVIHGDDDVRLNRPTAVPS